MQLRAVFPHRSVGRRSCGDGDDKILRETLGIVDIYDKSINTGNSALDVLLSEKRLYCKTKDIALDFISDGSDISYIASVDIYVAFGNLLDNAIRAVETLDANRRKISFRILSHESFIMFTITNDYDGELNFANGLPVSTKDNPKEHGYGLVGVEMIVDKYGGLLKISADNGVFECAANF